MRDPLEFLHACARKIRHRTESNALVAAARCIGKHGAKSLSVYRCAQCSGWHLTSQERRRRG